MIKIKTLDLFDEFLLEHESQERISHYSSNSEACVRQMYWDWIKEDKTNPITPGAALKMKFGNAAEAIFSEFLHWAMDNKKPFGDYLIVKIEEQWKERYDIPGLKYPVTCKLDYGLELEGYGLVAIELKSMYGRGIVNIAKTNEPKKEHLGQIKLYTTNTPYKRIILPYLGRDNGYRTEFHLTDTPNGLLSADGTIYEIDAKDSYARFILVEEALETKTLPGRSFLAAIKDGDMKDKFTKDKVDYKTDWQCSYCGYKDLCWRDKYIEYKRDSNIDMYRSRASLPVIDNKVTSEW